MAKKIRWVPKAHLNYDYFSLTTVAKVFRKDMAKVIGFPFDYKYENLDVFYNEDNIEKHAQILTKNPSLIKKQINHIKKEIPIFLKDSKKYGSKKDIKSFEKWYLVYRKFLPVLGIVFGIEFALERILKTFLNDDDFHKIAFSKETDVVEEQKSLFNLAKIFDDRNKFKKALKNHLKRFAWIGNKMMNYSPFTEEEVISRVKEIKNNWREKLEEVERNRRNMMIGEKDVIKKINKNQLEFVRLYQEILFLRTERALIICRGAELTYPLFSWLCKNLGYKRKDLLKFSKEEIIEMFKAGKKKSPVGRDKYHATFINGKLKIFWGSFGSSGKKISNVEEIKGTIACRGFAKGIVKIIKDNPDIKKVNKGDILVASYTNPNMVVGMEKSAAIITNIGGMTSHAAIVSREMNKPCIIGTKIATKVLKDGDFVEVDANKGVVRIIKKAR